MKTKLLSVAFMTLTVCAMWSQSTTAEDVRPHRFLKPGRSFSPDTTDLRPITFPFWMVREIALDLEEKSRLETDQQLLALELQTYKALTTGLQENHQRKDLQLELSRKQLALLDLQLKAARASKPRPQILRQALQWLGALAAGFVLGRL